METINISLPKQLKQKSELLVKSGMYASFSDLVRDSLRDKLRRNKYDVWAAKAREEYARGDAAVLETKEDVEKYFKKVFSEE